MRAGLTFQAAQRRWPARTQGPRELDICRLLRNTRAREGSRHWLKLVDGTLAECQANQVGGRWVRQLRLKDATHATGWMAQADAMGWAIMLDQEERDAGKL